MSGYTINRFSSTPLVTVEDGTTNDDFTHIKFVGRNVAGYGEIQNENFLKLLENFSSITPPAKPILGQIWYNPITNTFSPKYLLYYINLHGYNNVTVITNKY